MGRVAAVFTGGTISMLPDPVTGGARPALRGADILALIPGLSAIADIETLDWGLVAASHFTFAQLLQIARLLAETLDRPEVDGAVVVQGTDTIEETAFLWDLVLPPGKPVIVTGAMRNAAAADYDGPRNLTDAVTLAASREARGLGVLVTLNTDVLAAADAVKADTAALDSFRSWTGQPLGRVARGGLVMPPAGKAIALPSGRERLNSIPAAAAEPIHPVLAAVATDGALLRSVGRLRPAGVVVAATGSGNTDPDILAAATELMAAGIPVCLASRCFSGHVAPSYSFPGGGATWLKAGVLLSRLPATKARVGMAIGLGAGLARDELAALLRAAWS